MAALSGYTPFTKHDPHQRGSGVRDSSKPTRPEFPNLPRPNPRTSVKTPIARDTQPNTVTGTNNVHGMTVGGKPPAHPSNTFHAGPNPQVGYWERAAAGTQPRGTALPPLSNPRREFREHLDSTVQMDVRQIALQNALSAAVRPTITSIKKDPTGATIFRKKAKLELLRLQKDLEPIRAAWEQLLPATHPARHINFPLLMELVRVSEFPDPSICEDLHNGMPITGQMRSSATLMPRVVHATATLDSLRGGLLARNMRICKWIRKYSDDSSLQLISWNKTMDEVSKGWMGKPEIVSEEALSTFFLTPRFVVKQQGPNNVIKHRMIDDFKANSINATVGYEESYKPQDLDYLFTLTQEYHMGATCPQLFLCSMDFCHAFKNIPLRCSDSAVMRIALLNPQNGEIYTCQPQRLPFGSRQSPGNWGKTVTLLQHLLTFCLRVIAGAFVDDLFITEPESTIHVAFRDAKWFLGILGFLTDPSKDNLPAINIHLLGADLRVQGAELYASIDPQRLQSLRDEIRSILAKGSLSPGQASKLRGRLGFASSLLFGRVGRAMTRPLIERQYQGTSYAQITASLEQCLTWWFQALPILPPRTVTLGATRSVAVYTDATGYGHVGVYTYNGTTAVAVNIHLPQWILRSGGIFEFELAAAHLGMCVAKRYYPGDAIFACVDNTGAMYTLVRGNAHTELGASIIQAFWLEAAMGCGVSAPYTWIEYVNTHSNISDYESRRCPWDTVEREILQSFQRGSDPAPFNRTDGGCFATQTGPDGGSTAQPNYTVGDDGSRLYRQHVPRQREACLPTRFVTSGPENEQMSDHVPLTKDEVHPHEGSAGRSQGSPPVQEGPAGAPICTNTYSMTHGTPKRPVVGPGTPPGQASHQVAEFQAPGVTNTASLQIPPGPCAQVTAHPEGHVPSSISAHKVGPGNMGGARPSPSTEESSWYDQHDLPIPKYVQIPKRFVDAFQSHAALLHAARGVMSDCPTSQTWIPRSCPLSIPSRLAPVRRVQKEKGGTHPT